MRIITCAQEALIVLTVAAVAIAFSAYLNAGKSEDLEWQRKSEAMREGVWPG
jgi:hypothetical protein